MDTVIGWEEEDDLAYRILNRARHHHIPANALTTAEHAQSAGEHELAVEMVIDAGAPITKDLAAEIRRAWLDGRAPDDWPEGRAGLRRALDGARIVSNEELTGIIPASAITAGSAAATVTPYVVDLADGIRVTIVENGDVTNIYFDGLGLAAIDAAARRVYDALVEGTDITLALHADDSFDVLARRGDG